MTSARSVAACLATLAATLSIACGPKHIAAPTRPGEALIVLLPDSDTASTGRASVRNRSGSADLAAERDAALARANRSPRVGTLSEPDVTRFFGDALSALPPVPKHFTLYFLFESDELTDESRALLPEIQNLVKERSIPEVVVVGHTDTMGIPQANYELALKRATTVRDLLVAAGFDGSTIEVTSHGEADLMIRTPDETPEPRNRRVEITVR
jgi:outer membrane protein OmpA-like peptidoglycan-associated protein